jgi:phytoene dehydrogenase-like protein
MVDVVVVGAGLAGLACAVRLDGVGLEVAVLERSARVGGRVGSDRVDGFTCDRGFQLLNPAYPEARRVLDLTALRLQPLPGAVVVADEAGRRVFGDPRRASGRLFAQTLRGDLAALDAGAGLAGVRATAALARWGLACALSRPADLLSSPDEPWGQALDRLGIAGPLRSGVLEQFLAGVLAEADGSTSRRFVELLIRSFVRGRPSVPWEGMQAVPDQLAAALPAGTVRLGVAVTGVTGSGARHDGGTLDARAVVVAADPATAGSLTGCHVPATRALTTFWHAAYEPVSPHAALHLDATRRGPVVNTVVLSNAARAYSPDQRSLVASTVLGLPSTDPGDSTSEEGVRCQLARIYGVDTGAWQLVRVHELPRALTAMPPPLDVRRPVDLGDGLFVAGDHRDSASVQGALVSGRRAADAVLRRLGVPVPARPPLDALTGTRRPTVPGLGLGLRVDRS